MLYGKKGGGDCALASLALVNAKSPADTKAIAGCIAELFDVQLPQESLDVLTTVVDRRGGMKVLANGDSWAGVMDRSLMLLMAAPEMQVC